ncbi:MAG TPA: hypothetical protein VFJ24_09390 [Gaiellales bacterium]|nr:hypothetical protein [Gaiellales bacterium]
MPRRYEPRTMLADARRLRAKALGLNERADRLERAAAELARSWIKAGSVTRSKKGGKHSKTKHLGR